ncbi:MAG TPA: hypothetical protein VGZ47_22910 [Gemmataceae bacterium]|nr:hypothetical protein [Gemmataceae bacterium]
MSRRRLLILGGAVFGTLGIAIGGFGFFMYVALDINDSGSPQFAREWRSKLNAWPSYAAAMTRDPEIQGRQFRNGEWVMGYARDSHNRWHRGGGTLVVKDSRGDVRIFFGHVCGSHPYFFVNPESGNLDAFYKDLREHWDLVEQEIP